MSLVSHRENIFMEGGIHRCVLDRVVDSVRWHGSKEGVNMSTIWNFRQLFSLSDNDVLVRTNNTTVVYYVNKQGRLVLCPS